MIQQIDGIWENGRLRLLTPFQLPDGTPVKVTISANEASALPLERNALRPKSSLKLRRCRAKELTMILTRLKIMTITFIAHRNDDDICRYECLV